MKDNKLVDLKKAFKGKKVFITGHTGFKGTWMSFLLSELGAEVTGYALEPENKKNHFDLLGMRDRIRHVKGDILNSNFLRESLEANQPEYVFHLAAQALVRPAYRDPVGTFSTNVIGSANLLEAVRFTKSVKSLIYVTSDKCYENLEWIWGYRETDTLGGRDPYSASKAAAEILFSSYNRSYFVDNALLATASVRAGNVVGGGDWSEDRIIPDFIRSIENGQAINLRNPNATRPWQHVLEPISGYLMLGALLASEGKKWSGAWNFGPSSDQVRTVKEVSEMLVEEFGRGQIKIDNANTKIPHEANLLQLNCDKAQQMLGWRPRWNVLKTMSTTAEWYKLVLRGDDPAEVTKRQIYQYFEELL